MGTIQSVPAGPIGQPVLGNILAFVRNPFKLLTDCNHFGTIAHLKLLHMNIYVVNDPHAIEKVLVDNNRDFHRPLLMATLLKSMLGEGLATKEGADWLRQRRAIQPAFARERLMAYGELIVEHTGQLMGGWSDGQVVDMQQEMMHLTMSVIGQVICSLDLGAQKEGLLAAFDTVLREFTGRLNQPINPPLTWPTPANKRYHKALHNLDKVIYRIIAERRKAQSADTKDDLLSLLLNTKSEVVTTDNQLRDEIVTLLMAGYETTANLLTWVWYLLATHPEVESKLTEELERVLPDGRTPTVADLHELKYTELIVRETLRLYPGGAIITRRTTRDCELGGYHLKSGTDIWLSPWAVHHNPTYYDQPEAFKPSRWADGQLAKELPKFAYFPFGGGPKQCIGNNLALLEATLALATIAQKYRLKVVPGQLVVPAFGVTVRPKYGLKMRLTRR